MADGDLLWEPGEELLERSAMARFMRARGCEDYAALWQWSVDDAGASMPGASWFPGTQLNYAERLFRGKPGDRVAIRHASETRAPGDWTWDELRAHTAAIRAGLVARGVGRGDRVAAYLPNIPETIAAFFATASLGAVWSSAAPEFGARSVIDRQQDLRLDLGEAVDDAARAELGRRGGPDRPE